MAFILPFFTVSPKKSLGMLRGTWKNCFRRGISLKMYWPFRGTIAGGWFPLSFMIPAIKVGRNCSFIFQRCWYLHRTSKPSQVSITGRESVPKLLGQPLRLSGHECDEVCILLLIKSLLCCSKMWSREVPDYPCISQDEQTKLHPTMSAGQQLSASASTFAFPSDTGGTAPWRSEGSRRGRCTPIGKCRGFGSR